MKRFYLFLTIAISVSMLIGASVWEGSAEVDTGQLPETGLYIATNSFPARTLVYVTNLENGRIACLMVTSSLNGSGLLASLSKDAAFEIGIEEGTIGRIRMSESSDQLARSGFGGVYDPDAMVNLDDYDFALIPAEERPPIADTESEIITFIPQNTEPEIPVVSYREPALYSFSAPLIDRFEIGKYYLQIGAYSRTDTVESELSKIDNNLPKAIMNIGSNEKPVFRVLIGPLNIGESGALLQRYRVIYSDAFVWQGR